MATATNSTGGTLWNRIADPLKFSASFIGILVAIHLLGLAFEVIKAFGIHPRTGFGLIGIFFYTLLHSDWPHLFHNATALFILFWLGVGYNRRLFLRAALMIWFLTGIAVWLFGSTGNHIGASGLAYGLMAFFLFNGIFRRNLRAILVALVIVFIFISNGFLLGIIDFREDISASAHIFGFLSGAYSAYHLRAGYGR